MRWQAAEGLGYRALGTSSRTLAFFLGLTNSLQVWAKGSQDPRRITMAVLSEKSAKGTRDDRLLYINLCPRILPQTSRMGTHVQGGRWEHSRT